MTLSRLMRVPLVVFLGMTVIAARGQQGQWAGADNPTAKFIVDAERQWAEAACTHNKIAETILADDFQGTSPEDGKRYAKSKEVADNANSSTTARDCRLTDAKVRLFGDKPGDGVRQREFNPKNKRRDREVCLLDLDRYVA